MHSLHVGYVGLMGNLHYIEIVDFILGIPGWDIRGDDKATWLVKQEKARSEQEAAIASLPDDFSTPASPAPERAPAKRSATVDTTSLGWRP